jgi:hypothetical protein
MIRSNPAPDMQGNLVKPGDTILYITHQHGDFKFSYAKVKYYKQINRKYVSGQTYALVVELLNTDLKYARRILRNPIMLKCGVELAIPTDTQIEGMQE